ncbi:MAG: class II aldolase/adducin family protein [Arenicellales bacterium]|nr:class II aldolase/adducin family protein [Arenicellales bacterium]
MSSFLEERKDLAAAYRWCERCGFHEGVDNHLSVMISSSPPRFLINPRGRHWSRMTSDSLLVIDEHGNTIDGAGEALRTGPTIHVSIHQIHPNANVVLHTHMPYATALTAIKGGELRQVHQNSARFLNQCAYDRTFNGLAFDMNEGRRLAETMGEKRVLFMAHHGVVVVGPNVAEALDDLYYLERACETQWLAASMQNEELQEITPEVAQRTATQFQNRSASAKCHFEEIKRLLNLD